MPQHTRRPPSAATPSDLLVTTVEGCTEELGHDIPQGQTRGQTLTGATGSSQGDRTLHGVFRTMRPDDDLATARMHFHDAYRGTRDGRAVTIASAWIALNHWPADVN